MTDEDYEKLCYYTVEMLNGNSDPVEVMDDFLRVMGGDTKEPDEYDAAEAMEDAIKTVGTSVVDMWESFGGEVNAGADIVVDGVMYRVSVSVSVVDFKH